MPILHENRLRGSVAAACLLVLLTPGLAAAASDPAAPVSPAPFEIGQLAAVKHLPAGPDDLMFRGESVHRRFPVYLTRDEAAVTRSFQIAFKNTVTVLPERSSIALTVNGQLLSTIPVSSANALTTIPITLPVGMLKPGLNDIDMHVVMAHRVDCSVAASYELWTAVDGSATGFVVPASARNAIDTLADIAAEPLGQDGTTRIVLRNAADPTPDALSRAGRFIGAMVARAGLKRPIVETSPDQERGAGFDVLLSTAATNEEAAAGLKIVGQADGLLFARDPATQRLVVILSGRDDAALDAEVSAFASKAAIVPDAERLARIDGQARRTFAELGIQTERFAGHHYVRTIALELPTDFYAADYDKARLLIDGAYATDLDPTSGLVFRVNDQTAASLDLAGSRDGLLRSMPVELPLRFFHPGHNEIAIDGTMAAPADRLCAASDAAVGPRFSLSDTSELLFPRFARLGTAPQIGTMLASVPAADQSRGPIYLADSQPASLATGLTMLANLAAHGHAAELPAIHVGSPQATDAPGIVVGPWNALPAELSASLVGGMVGADHPKPSNTVEARDGGDLLLAQLARVQDALASGKAWADRWIDLASVRESAERLLGQQGFAYGAKDQIQPATFTPRSLLVQAVEPRIRSTKFAGFDVPRFVADQQQWVVVTAPDSTVLEQGMDRIVADDRWATLQGEAVSLDMATGKVSSASSGQPLYVMPRQLVASDVAPILGGLIGSNIELSLAALVALMVLLGLSTHVLIRKAGAK